MRIVLSSARGRLPREIVDMYLRTGILAAPRAAGVETKFNPWHDELGRFTFGSGARGSRARAIARTGGASSRRLPQVGE